jgi:hypothetical protein
MGQWGLLVLAGEASAAVHPGESRLDDPATRLGDKAALEIDPADDLDREPQDPAHGLHDAAGVALVGPQMAEPGAAGGGSAEQPGQRRPILHAGRGDQHGHQQAQGVHDDVAFDAVDLLGAVEASRTTNG